MLGRVPSPGQEVGAWRDAYLDALLARRAAEARSVVAQARDEGLSVPDLYLQVFAPALHQVGHQWAMGELNVAEEHFATAVTQELLATLAASMRVPPYGGRLAVVTGTPGELHALGALMVGDFLQGDGWEVIQLGASTPAADLAQLVDSERPDVVALSTATTRSMPQVADVVKRLQALHPRPLIAVGGQLWTAQASRVAHQLAVDIIARDPRMLVATLRDRVPALE